MQRYRARPIIVFARMRSPFWKKLFLALALVSGLSLAGFAAWQQREFRQGFIGYLDEITLQRAQPIVPALAAEYAKRGNWNFLRENGEAFGVLVETASPSPNPVRPPANGRFEDQRRGPPDGDRADFRGAQDRKPGSGERSDRRLPGPGGRPGPPPRPRRGPPDLMPRLLLLDADQKPVIGNPNITDTVARLPIVSGGNTVGTLLLQKESTLQNSADISFARAQTRNAAIAGLVTLAASLMLAFVLARWLLAPVRALADGTRALTAGNFDRRVDATRKDELGALALDFNQLTTTLEQNRDARRQWGADIAHELRTPLSILRGEIQAMQDGVRPLSQGGLASLQAECERLGCLIEDLYQLALADAGALDYHYETVDIGELLVESVEHHRPALVEAGLVLRTAIAPSLIVAVDARRFGQLIDNLLVNARRYTDAPGVVRISLDPNGDYCRLIVEDSAPGVPSAALQRLFERLFRVDASRHRATGGAGLGLAISQAIVAAHGGSIDAEHSALGGLRIVAEFPLEPAGS
ncbi:MAG: ATP-binding protein [Dokdonella sp.]